LKESGSKAIIQSIQQKFFKA